MGPATVSLM